jgi:hypothetical protein
MVRAVYISEGSVRGMWSNGRMMIIRVTPKRLAENYAPVAYSSTQIAHTELLFIFFIFYVY